VQKYSTVIVSGYCKTNTDVCVCVWIVCLILAVKDLAVMVGWLVLWSVSR